MVDPLGDKALLVSASTTLALDVLGFILSEVVLFSWKCV
jgi:hypothetical protein